MHLKNYLTLLMCLGTLSLFAQPPAYVPTEGLLSWWGMENVTDATTNGNTLTAYNMTLTTDRFGTANAAYSFNGTSSYLTRTSIGHTFTQAGSFSVSIWIKKATAASGVAIMSGTTTSLNFIWLVQCDATKAIFGTNKQQSAWFWTNATTNYVLNEWEHYVGVYTANTMTFYRNGVLQGTTTNTHTNVSQAVLPIWIGRGVSGNYFNGSLDDVGIWNRALTPNEIAVLYQSTLSVDAFSAANVKVYPNPASDFLHLEADAQNIGANYQIIDDLERIVATGVVVDTATEISIANLKTGLYFLKMGEQTPLKFIKH
jgi:Concanavalin A-like lectin/glucanases superfamily/Secretion system C-terminal sorting domain